MGTPAFANLEEAVSESTSLLGDNRKMDRDTVQVLMTSIWFLGWWSGRAYRKQRKRSSRVPAY